MTQVQPQPNEFGCIIDGAISLTVLDEVAQRAFKVYTSLEDTLRLERAYAIILHERVQKIARDMFSVRSSDAKDAITYIVETDTNRCPCPDHTNRDVVCKHLYAAYLYVWTERRMASYAALDHQDHLNGNWEQRTIEDERYVWPS